MANIFARSPYLITIAELGQQGSKVELFFSGTTTFSNVPNYSLTKLALTPTNVTNIYDISEYCREYLFFNINNDIATLTQAPIYQYFNLKIKTYKLVNNVYTLLTDTNNLIFDGYGYFENNANFDLGNFHLDAGNYYYDSTKYAGKIKVVGTGLRLKYYNIVTNNLSLTTAATTQSVSEFPRLVSALQSIGAKVEIINSASQVQKTYYFYVNDDCKYESVVIDFVNKYGAWQREFFFKASNDTFSVENTEYNLMASITSNAYNLLEGQRKVFNANGKQSIKVNTGWVDEDWNNTLKQIMLSERILINSKPAKINTKSTELFKHINTKQINYSLEFEFAYDTINSII